ncbi:hypothetical protein [Enterovirga sp. CN4-39]|uniref:hypothetical protein n=1 Tax=Enterovirga sp. CN4-39 TaxID=3400910 RepID=UPI003C09CFE7
MPFLVFLIFVVVGPSIGVLVLVLETFVGAWTGLIPQAGPLGPWRVPSSSEIGVLVAAAYAFGGAQALLTSLVATLTFGFSDYTRVSLRAVMVTAALAGGCLMLLVWGPISWGIAAALMVVHLGAALGCWLIATGLIKAVGGPASPPPNHDAYDAAACAIYKGGVARRA